MKKLIIMSLFSGISISIFSQNLDPTLTTAVIVSGESVSSQRKSSNKILTNINEQQALLNAQMVKAHELQNKIYKGLSDVSSLISDGYEMKAILEHQKRIVEYSSDILSLSAKYPQYLWFTRDYINDIKKKTEAMYLDVASIIAGGATNLMNAGDRKAFLRSIRVKISLISADLMLMKYSLNRSIKLGLLKSLIDFGGFVNKDKKIVQDIIKRAERL